MLGSMPLHDTIKIETEDGELKVRFHRGKDDKYAVIVSKGVPKDGVFVRVQSSCLFSESLGAIDCDCAAQLRASLSIIHEEGGVLVYVNEEGRGLGLEKKIKAILLQQDEGLDTAEAFNAMGYSPDPRDFEIAVEALESIGIPKKVRLASNNPQKIDALRKFGLEVETVNLEFKKTKQMEDYLDRKTGALGHHGSD